MIKKILEYDDNKFVTKNVKISEENLDFMNLLAWEATHSRKETGGNFFGIQESKSTFLIGFTTGPGNNTVAENTLFIPDANQDQIELDRLNSTYDIRWIGSWHVHPRNMCGLSGTDISSMTEIVNDPECMDFYVAMVFSAYGKKMDYKCFLFEKGKNEINEMNIIVEQDVRIREKLPSRYKQEAIESQAIDSILLEKGFTDLQYSHLENHSFIEAKYNESNVRFCVPKSGSLSPSIRVNNERYFVPINWNDTCTFEDFVSCIDLNKLDNIGRRDDASL